MAGRVDEPELDARLVDLERARAWSPRVISRFEALIRGGSDLDVFRMNPIQYAADRGMAPPEAIDLFLHAAKIGLVEMDWHLICAWCGQVVHSLRTMSRLHAAYTCNCCSAENTATLDELIQVAFTVAPRVRDIAYHHPETLPIEDFVFRYHKSAVVAPVNGMTFAELGALISRHMTYLEPGATTAVELDVAPGMLSGADFIGNARFALFVSDRAAAGARRLRITLRDDAVESVGPGFTPQRLDLFGATWDFPNTQELPAGPLAVEITNTSPRRRAIWLYAMPESLGAPAKLAFLPFLSGKRVLNTQTFRDLFRSEVIGSDEGLAVRDITFVFTDLKGSTALYDRIGDANAYDLVRRHFEALGAVVRHHGGAIVKTIGDAVMATFETPADAVGAALAMRDALDGFTPGLGEKLILKVGVHRGHSIAVTLNDRADYFGQTVNVAARIQNLADAGEIYLSDTVYEAPGIAGMLGTAGHHPVAMDAMLKGVGETVRVYRVAR
jgi:class 3 adenylate cyclase